MLPLLFEVYVTSYCDFPEELVVDGGIKALGLHLRATCRKRSAAHFQLHLFWSSFYYVYRWS